MDTTTKVFLIFAATFLFLYYWRQYSNYVSELNKLTWPRRINPCPDYWVHEGNNVCRNSFNIGKCPLGNNGQLSPNATIDFNGSIYNGMDGSLNKCKWAKKCENSWEGIDKLCA